MLIMAVLLLTLLFLTTTILSLAENINIDCGASESDVRSWVGDEGFIITTGKSLTFKIPGEKNKPFRSLRSFPSDQVNCYGNIPATRGRETLVRTVFYYGNYDGKSSPPSFSVIYDLKHIDNVTFSTVSSPSDVDQSVFISEVIFSPERENISVCLFRTSPLDVPFISSIEVYVMDAGMYDDIGPNEGLLLRRRSAFGAKEAISDPYGRVWFPIRPNNPVSSELINTSPSSIDTTDVPNKPPAIVMSKALLKNAIKLSDKTLAGSSLYLALYFSEPQSLGHTKKRSFNVFFDTKQLSSVPIVPVFGKATQFVIRDIVATSTSQLIFQSTSDSDLPPIVNAIELHSILKARHIGANIGGQRGGGNEGEEEQSGGGDGPEDRRKKKEQADKAAGVMRKQLDGVPPRKPKLPLILGVTLGSAFAAVSSVFAAIFCKRSQNAKPQSNTEPAMSTGAGEEAGVAPLVGQQLASDASHPGKR